MASVNQTRPHCVNQMGKTYSKPLAAWHGRGSAWTRHAMCESALSSSQANVRALLSVHHGGAQRYFIISRRGGYYRYILCSVVTDL